MNIKSIASIPRTTSKKRAVVFCPDIDGHRQNYCCVISDWFLSSEFNVVLAAGRSAANEPAARTPLIGVLAQRPGVHVLDLGDTTNSHLIHGRWIKTLREIEERVLPEWTFFPTGDEMRISLSGFGNEPESRTIKRAAIFISMHHCYPRDHSDEKNLSRLRSWYRWQKNMAKGRRYSRDEVWGSLGLDVAFSTNADFIRNVKDKRFYYLHEIYRAWGFELSGQQDQIQRLCEEYRSFLAKHPGKDVILYYGGWAARRGYDKLLHLVSAEPDTIFVSCGRPTDCDDFQYDVDTLRAELKRQDRIYEVELPFMPNNEFVDLLYRSCNFVLLPYYNFYGPSGILVEAAAFGKPVLVPSVGHMNSMVKQHGIGLRYRHGDDADFVKQFRVLRKTFSKYSDSAMRYGESFTREKIHEALASALLGN